MGSDHRSDSGVTSNQGLVTRPEQVELSDPDTGEILGIALGSASSSEGNFVPDDVVSKHLLPTLEPRKPETREHPDYHSKPNLEVSSRSIGADLRTESLGNETTGSDDTDREYWPDSESDKLTNQNHDSPTVTDPERRLKSRGLEKLEYQLGAHAPLQKSSDGLFQSRREPDDEYWPDDSVEPSDLVIQPNNPIDGWSTEPELRNPNDGGPTTTSDFPTPAKEQLPSSPEDKLGKFLGSDQAVPPRPVKPYEEKIRGVELGINKLASDSSKDAGEIDLGGATHGHLDQLGKQTDPNLTIPTSPKSSNVVANNLPEKTDTPTAQPEELSASSNNIGPMKPETIDQDQEELYEPYTNDDVKNFSNGLQSADEFAIQKVVEKSSQAKSLADGISTNEVEDDSRKSSQLPAPANGIETQLEQIDSEPSDLDEAHSDTLEDRNDGGLSQVDQKSGSFAASIDDVAVDDDPSKEVDKTKLNEIMPDRVDEFTEEIAYNLTSPISSEADDVIKNETPEKVEVPRTTATEKIASSFNDDTPTEPETLDQYRQQGSRNNYRTIVEGSASGVVENGSIDATQFLHPLNGRETQLELTDFEAFDLDEEEDTLGDGEGSDFSRADRKTQSLGYLQGEVDGDEGTDELDGSSSEIGYPWDAKDSFDTKNDDSDDDIAFSNETQDDWLFEDWGKDPEHQDDVDARSDANEFHDYSLPWRVSELAALLVERLPIVQERKQEEAFYDICEILKEFPAGSSHAAIARIVSKGVSLEEIFEVTDLKRHWHECEELWLRRHLIPGQGWTTFLDIKNGSGLLTWSTANKLLKFGSASAIVDVMLPEWREAWIDMRISDELLASGEWFNFSTYVSAIANQKELSNCIDFDCRWPSTEPEFRIDDDYKVPLSMGLLSRENDFSLRETQLNSRSDAWQSRALAPSVFDDGSVDEESS